jgi:hypothetical protein
MSEKMIKNYSQSGDGRYKKINSGTPYEKKKKLIDKPKV